MLSISNFTPVQTFIGDQGVCPVSGLPHCCVSTQRRAKITAVMNNNQVMETVVTCERAVSDQGSPVIVHSQYTLTSNINPHPENPILRDWGRFMINARMVEKKTFRVMAQELNAQGSRSPFARPWTRHTLCDFYRLHIGND